MGFKKNVVFFLCAIQNTIIYRGFHNTFKVRRYIEKWQTFFINLIS